MKNAIILAAGKGRRMKSNTNKVMHPLLNKPVIGHVVDTLESIGIKETHVVVGHLNEGIQEYLGDRVFYAFQDEQLGTGDAVKKVTQLENRKGCTLVLFGDSGLIQAETFNQIIEAHQGHDLTVATAVVQNPGRYNRVIRDTQGNIKKIVRESLATPLEQTSNEINLSVYCFNNELLYKYLPEIENDMKEELNIIDLVSIMRKNGHSIQALRMKDASEFMGVNDRFELHEANKWLQHKINKEHMLNGVSILDMESTFIGPDVQIASDVTIYPGNHIYGKSILEKGVVIGPNSYLDHAHIKANTKIDASRIVNSTVGENSTVGPYAHIREHTEVKDHVRIGNFVELKTTTIDNHTSAAHLSYLGNAKVGKYVNIGCGVVSVNYDGKNKHETTIGDHSFIGSHTALIAPIKVGENAVVAAGSVIHEDVENGELAISRSNQVNKKDSGKKYLSEKGKI